MGIVFANNAVSTLAGALLSSQTTLTVATGTGGLFPAPTGDDFFKLTVEDRRTQQIEVMHCTGRSGDVLTVVRAQENMAALDFLAGATVSNRYTRDTADAILDEVPNPNPWYLGPFATNPTTDNDGNPLQAGHQYFNTGDTTLYLYTGASWVAYPTASPVTSQSGTYILNDVSGDFDGAETEFDLRYTDYAAVTQTPDVTIAEQFLVFLNGVRQNPGVDYTIPVLGTIEFAVAPAATDTFEGVWVAVTSGSGAGDFMRNGSTTMTANLPFGGFRGVNLANGINPTDAVNLSQVSALSSVYQPLDSDLTAIAALTTTAYGRAFLALADASALTALNIASQVEAEAATINTRVMTPLRTKQLIQSRGIVIPQDFGALADGVANDTAAFIAALATGLPLMIPETNNFYLVDGAFAVPSGAHIFGHGVKSHIKIANGITDSLFDIASNSNITIEDTQLEGNCAVTLTNTGSSAVICNGATNVRLLNNYIHHWARHGTSLDAVVDLIVEGNIVEDSRWGSGVLVSTTAQSTNVSILNNTIRRTQMANIHGFFGVENLRVIGNYCDGTDAGVTVAGGGQTADNITFYQEDAGGLLLNVIIEDNICLNSGNHGMHVGGDGVSIIGNRIEDPTHGGIAFFKGDNTTPDPAVDGTVSNNKIKFADRTVTTAVGINIRNYTDWVANGNTIIDAYDAFEINGIDTAGVGVSDGMASGNVIKGYGHYGWRLRNKVAGNAFVNNKMTAHGPATTEDFHYSELSGSVITDNEISGNLSSGADTVYSQGPGWLAWTPVFTFATPGDLAVVHNVQEGRYRIIGKSVEFSFYYDFNITHTTASGDARVTGLPKANGSGHQIPINLVENKIDFGAGNLQLVGQVGDGVSYVQFRFLADAAAVANVTTTAFPTGVSNYVLIGSGRYEIS